MAVILKRRPDGAARLLEQMDAEDAGINGFRRYDGG